MGIVGDFLLDEGHSVLFSTHITADLDRIGDYVTLIHDGRIVRTGTKDEILEAYRVVRGGPDDLSGFVGVQLIGLRRTSTGAQALVRTEEADLLGGDVLVEVPTLEEIAVHIGARVPRRSPDPGASGDPGSEPHRGAGRREPDSSMSTGFNVSDKAGLETLYAVLPLSRRTVLYGHYAWATACFLATATVGTALALLLARVQAVPFGGRTLVTMLTLSWALFAVNVAIQFPLLTRFGFTRASVLGTTLPLVLVVGTIYKLHLDIASIQNWPTLLCTAGVAALVMSVAVATATDRRRPRYRVPQRDGRTGRYQ